MKTCLIGVSDLILTSYSLPTSDFEPRTLDASPSVGARWGYVGGLGDATLKWSFLTTCLPWVFRGERLAVVKTPAASEVAPGSFEIIWRAGGALAARFDDRRVDYLGGKL
jgi:hypothetical protein